jgi:hypothetical protein
MWIISKDTHNLASYPLASWSCSSLTHVGHTRMLIDYHCYLQNKKKRLILIQITSITIEVEKNIHLHSGLTFMFCAIYPSRVGTIFITILAKSLALVLHMTFLLLH